jgi:hypothetical protein
MSQQMRFCALDYSGSGVFGNGFFETPIDPAKSSVNIDKIPSHLQGDVPGV